jgi:TetR/AcrR family transcriptional regulator of autoinduction and epiphytic fitness
MSDTLPPEVEREAILDAASSCFAEFGYESTSLDAIADRCGLGSVAVARYFASKEDVRKALMGLWSERLSAWITSA